MNCAAKVAIAKYKPLMRAAGMPNIIPTAVVIKPASGMQKNTGTGVFVASHAEAKAPKPNNFLLNTDARYYYLVLFWFVLLAVLAVNLRRSRDGRALVALRDYYLSAEMLGINLTKYRLLAFGISSFYAGVGGALYGHYLGFVSAEGFNIFLSVLFIGMIIIGGMGAVSGAIMGAAFLVLLPEVMEAVFGGIASTAFAQDYNLIDSLPYFKEMAIGLAIVLFLMFEPDGLRHRWLTAKAYWKYYPFSH